ncbi:MAG: 3-isopropylmalate dehydratase large subunit [Candidatus Rokubacteria bacterium RIFCSPLOWO2_02_FULL_72_37]|nr:MAG: 3-isopropylmalate dehydratase large subunit [Candidatus Rokubacteria bacterium RIFCSPLOWO2_02_FULL_72_37]
MVSAAPRTMFEKIWARHVVTEGPGGNVLLYVGRHLLHEGSTAALGRLAAAGRRVRRPDLTFATADHYLPTAPGAVASEPEIVGMVDALTRHTGEQGILYFGVGDARRGIVHVIGPEQGLTLPGTTLVCGDSHTATHGAFGALAFGIGSTEVEHVLATQTLWQKKPRVMRITVEGRLGPGVTAKDVILALIAGIGAAGGVGHAIEYAGSTIRAMSMDERMTVCNMSIEAGARTGMVAPDATTFAYLEGRPLAPAGAAWVRALADWQAVPGDAGAVFDREVELAASEIAPTVTWGTSPQDALPITGRVPDPAAAGDAARRASMERALAYMGLAPGTPLTEIAVGRVFIGSCTNSRLEDLRAAARVVQGRRAVVPAWVVPGSGLIKRAAEAEGLDRIFVAAGFEWREAGCSMCVGMNGETARPGERVASTSNRNFEGRQGRGARTHLVSPAMAAAAAVTGRFVDVRTLDRR